MADKEAPTAWAELKEFREAQVGVTRHLSPHTCQNGYRKWQPQNQRLMGGHWLVAVRGRRADLKRVGSFSRNETYLGCELSLLCSVLFVVASGLERSKLSPSR